MRLVAEWEKQSAVQLTWPDENTPWEALEDVQSTYVDIIHNIVEFELVLLVCFDIEQARQKIVGIMSDKAYPLSDLSRVRFVQTEINDTWARDHGAISVFGDKGEKYIYDFVFNGWGQKFASCYDNYINKNIFFQNVFQPDVMMVDMRPFVLEGGSIDTDGKGTLLTTTDCLCSKNRNEYLTKEEIEGELKQAFGLNEVIWIEGASITGDDTDSHVDILARFVNENTIVYASCSDSMDEDYQSLKQMEAQLQKIAQAKNYKLVALDNPKPMFLDSYRLPASYVNFLIINGAVLVPQYNCEEDSKILDIFKSLFPDRQVRAINCYPLLSGHGSLHCITMQFPDGYVK